MSITDLMLAVRSGDFEPEFKKCESTNDKILLFKKYGVVISLEQYRYIEEKVASIKQGAKSSYEGLKDKVENNVTDVSDVELMSVAGGRKLNKEEQAVYEVLKRMPNQEENKNHSDEDDHIKLWGTKPFLTGRGLF